MREDFKNICWKNIMWNICFVVFILISLYLYLMSGRFMVLDFPFSLMPGAIFNYELVPFRNLYLELTGSHYMNHIQNNIFKIVTATCFNLLFMLKFKNKAEAAIYSLAFYAVAEVIQIALKSFTRMAHYFAYYFNIDNLIYYIAGIFIAHGISKAIASVFGKYRKHRNAAKVNDK